MANCSIWITSSGWFQHKTRPGPSNHGKWQPKEKGEVNITRNRSVADLWCPKDGCIAHVKHKLSFLILRNFELRVLWIDINGDLYSWQRIGAFTTSRETFQGGNQSWTAPSHAGSWQGSMMGVTTWFAVAFSAISQERDFKIVQGAGGNASY